MNFWFEMAVNAVEVTLILSFLVQYFGYKTETPAKYWGTALIWILSFCIVAFFSWTHLYENYASSLQILVNILFCVTLLRGNIFQKIFVSAFTMGLVAITATLTTLLVAKLSGNQVAFLLSHFSGIRVTSICLTKLLFFVTEYRCLLFVYPFGQSRKNQNRNGAARAAERMSAGKRQGH